MTWERPTRTVQEQNHFAHARAAEKLRQAADSDKAARIVAKQAVDAQDCQRLLSMLGLDYPDEKS
ncbi:hypothetical protein ACVGVM_20645 [Pseudonocardia bannensis]|uniref:Uncharacterized protein n=1 Tax=Pseudonocardia bannensis TaxID=630973 RepID=A0A848DFY2_9PSEU|nr:hypothetical protein [Pseudonocardia bannensis]NMH91441.1 hypothetical protein [Pseudonocardia bannensis]